MGERGFLGVALLAAMALPAPVFAQAAGDFDGLIAQADALDTLETVLISVGGETILAEGFDGHAVDAPHNIKSASKTIVATLVGIAIAEGVLEGVDQPIAPLLADAVPEDADPRLGEVTIGDLLAMQAGLTPTSNEYYGRWTASSNWVEYALAQPFIADPGTGWQYSTGSTHLLSAILTAETGRTTLDLAEDWLGLDVAGWDRDPQGIYLGGNNMAITPEALLAFGVMFLEGGETPDGTAVIAPQWIEDAWTARSHSPRRGDDYGYGWFLTEVEDEPVRYAWGYGGQMLYVVPSLDMAMVVTSDENQPSAGTGYLMQLQDLLAEAIRIVRG